ncbi:hypothetical protein AYI69_g2935 [Smittium culicis]|uniref:Uncharacterized protein n=2 Tax=Smittium culicis TaxID=133412 RepID=A0A1R1YL43_9FUNG|nr:hypothetical protein AYI69_g2935 [Smittium culicis]
MANEIPENTNITNESPVDSFARIDSQKSSDSSFMANFDTSLTESSTTIVDECSVRDALDQLFYCWTVGKQVKNIYRYGTKIDCSKQVARLKLCAKTKVMDTETAAATITKHLNETAELKREMPNVLDVWKKRTTKLENFPPED